MKENLVISEDFKKFLSEKKIRIDQYGNGVIRIRTDSCDLLGKTISRLLECNPKFEVSTSMLIPEAVSPSGLISIFGAIIVFSKKVRMPISDFRCGPSNIG